MRNLALALGALAVLIGVGLEACSDDVETTPSPTTTGSVGGSGGGTSSTTSTPSGGSGGSVSCDGVGGGTCDQACCKIETECSEAFGYPITCSMINGIVGDILDCENNQPTADCNGSCILAADCADLPTLVTSSPDPTLYACLQGCNGGTCMACVADQNNCLPQLSNCMQDTGHCDLFLQCMRTAGGAGGAGGGAPCEDPTCRDYCASQHGSTATTALIDCTCAHCASECSQCGSGGSGTGGAGGGGGAGGT